MGADIVSFSGSTRQRPVQGGYSSSAQSRGDVGAALSPGTMWEQEQLEENAHQLAQIFGKCRVEPNEKWAKYLVREVP